jgi:AraC-like DNA-binding protein
LPGSIFRFQISSTSSDFDRPLRIEDLARELGMSVSGFHHHFRAVTAMSPLQFQKQLCASRRPAISC